MHDRLGVNAAAIQFPDATEDAFSGIIDIIDEKYYVYKDEKGEQIEVQAVPEQFKEKLNEYKHVLFERLADADDTMMEMFLEEKDISPDDIRQAIRRAVVKSEFLPVLCGTALRNRGVQLLLDAIVDYLPSPLDVPPVTGISPDNPDEELIRETNVKSPFSGLVFKVATDPYVGKLFYTRIYSGKVESGSQVYNSSEKVKERIAKIVVMHSNKQEIAPATEAGDIVALIGLKNTKSGNTICDPHNKIILENMKIPEPVVSMAIEPKSKADQDKLGLTLKKFLDEDPSLRVQYDHDTAQTIISGMGELHLEIIIDRMKREFNLETNIGRPQVAYKETITKSLKGIVGKFVSQTGGRGQYGHVVVDVKPTEEPGTGFVFNNKIKGGAIPREYIPAVEKGLKSAALNGILSGYPDG
jgi:elongation factor G